MFPALLLVLMLIVQFALYSHANSVAEAAAQDASAAARQADGSQVVAEAAARRTLDTLGPRMLTGRSVTVTRSTVGVSVSVSGTVVALVPGLKWRVRQTAAGPVERFVPIDEHRP